MKWTFLAVALRNSKLVIGKQLGKILSKLMTCCDVRQKILNVTRMNGGAVTFYIHLVLLRVLKPRLTYAKKGYNVE